MNLKEQQEERKRTQLLKVKEVARILNVCTKTVYRLIEAGELKVSRLSSRMTRVFPESLDAFIKRNTERAW